MSGETKDINLKQLTNNETNENEVVAQNNLTSFQKSIIRLNAIASLSNISNAEKIPLAEEESRNGLKALNAEGGLQTMLAAQILSIHDLQQKAIALSKNSQHFQNIQYFTNAAIKLSNCFVNQTNLLARLQGNINQSVTVEKVDVRDGGQAMVGNVTYQSKDK